MALMIFKIMTNNISGKTSVDGNKARQYNLLNYGELFAFLMACLKKGQPAHLSGLSLFMLNNILKQFTPYMAHKTKLPEVATNVLHTAAAHFPENGRFVLFFTLCGYL